jgi:uncharacterized membrane protein
MLYLVWAELCQINAICLWCTRVHLAALRDVIAIGAGLLPAASPGMGRSPGRRDRLTC